MDRRKAVLGAIAGQVRPSDATALLAIANATANTDIELRGLAVDRLGETRNQAILPQLWALFDTINGGEANQEFTLRWKAGEAILKLGGPGIIPTFVQHLSTPRTAARGAPAFEGYTFGEINGYALTIGDFSPPPRDVMRGLLANANPYVKSMALLFLGARGEAADAARLAAAASDTTPITGPGWNAALLGATPPAGQTATVGRVAQKAQETLRRTLQPSQQGPGGAPAAAPAAP
jgi:hypothetical protein